MTQPAAGFRDWARLVFGPDYGNKMADDVAEAIGREFDQATFYGTETPPMTRPEFPGDDLANLVSDLAPDAETPAEHLGLLVGTAYGNALADRDEARDLAQVLGDRYAEALAHLEAVLAVSPVVSTFAHDGDTLTSAREFLARAVESSGTPEQES